jgi:hypothetical protein
MIWDIVNFMYICSYGVYLVLIYVLYWYSVPLILLLTAYSALVTLIFCPGFYLFTLFWVKLAVGQKLKEIEESKLVEETDLYVETALQGVNMCTIKCYIVVYYPI